MTEPALVRPEPLQSVQPTGALRAARYLDRGAGVIQDTHTCLYWLREPLVSAPANPADFGDEHGVGCTGCSPGAGRAILLLVKLAPTLGRKRYRRPQRSTGFLGGCSDNGGCEDMPTRNKAMRFLDARKLWT